MKKRPPKYGSIAYYIEEVVANRTKQETEDGTKNRYPPVVPELLLSLLMEVRSFCIFGRVLIGALLALIFKALIFG